MSREFLVIRNLCVAGCIHREQVCGGGGGGLLGLFSDGVAGDIQIGETSAAVT